MIEFFALLLCVLAYLSVVQTLQLIMLHRLWQQKQVWEEDDDYYEDGPTPDEFEESIERVYAGGGVFNPGPIGTQEDEEEGSGWVV